MNRSVSPFAFASAARQFGPESALWQAGCNPLDQQQALFDLADAHPDARVDVAVFAGRHPEGESVIGRIRQRAARVECTAGSPSDRAAHGELPCEFGGENAGADGAVLEGRGAVVKTDEARECLPHLGKQCRQAGHRCLGKIGGDAARHDPVHHQSMAEGQRGEEQHALAQCPAMGQHQREGGVVADGADVADVIGQPLQLRHQRPKPEGAWRHFDLQRGLHRAGEGIGIGDGRIA